MNSEKFKSYLRSELAQRAVTEPSKGCFSQEELQQFVAGTFNDDNLLPHAIECGHCGPLLRQATEDFALELTAEEEAVVASLPTSSKQWQADFVKNLPLCAASGSARPRAHRGPAVRFFGLPLSTAVPVRLAFGVVLLGVVALIFHEHRATVARSVPAQPLHTARPNPALKQPAPSTIASDDSTATHPPASAAHATDITSVSLTLEPGLSRGMSTVKVMKVPSSAKSANFTLRTAESPEGLMRETLLTASGEKVWSQQKSVTASEARGMAISLSVPARLLAPNDYRIIPSVPSANGDETVASYCFRVAQ